MTNLKKLYIRGKCGINKNELVGLNLTVLDITNNPDIFWHKINS